MTGENNLLAQEIRRGQQVSLIPGWANEGQLDLLTPPETSCPPTLQTLFLQTLSVMGAFLEKGTDCLSCRWFPDSSEDLQGAHDLLSDRGCFTDVYGCCLCRVLAGFT